MSTRRFSAAAAFLALAVLVNACNDSPLAPRSAPGASRSTAATSSLDPAGTVEILTQLTGGRCADVSGRSQNAGTRLISWTCHGAGNQQFALPPAGTTGPIHVYDGNTCVDASGGLGRDGDPIIIYPCNGGANQQWTVTAQGEIRGINGKCIDITGADSAEGTYLILYRCNGGANQHWSPGTAPVIARDLAVVRGDQAGVAAAPALVATFNVSSATSAVATITTPDGSVRTTQPVAVASGHARVVLLGLRPGTSYTIAGVGLTNGNPASTSASSTATTGSLPGALVGVRLKLTQGTPNGGYVLAPLGTNTGTVYVVAYDTTGALVWYRGFSGTSLTDVQQQPNGHYTVYVGDVQGSGVFHEFDGTGTILHDWAAPAGYKTDGHEIVLITDASGQSTAAMFFGRHSVPMDLSGHGGSANGTIETNTVFRVSAGGQATALFTGTDRFTAADWISPPLTVQALWDFDHANAIALTPDGGFVVSWRNLRALTKHDASGHFQWQLGGRQATLNYTGDPLGGFDGQHHIRMLPNGDFTFFDNGQLHSPPESRGVEVAVDATSNTATVVRIDHKLDETIISPTQGDYQRLSNGNGVLNYAIVGRIAEFTPSNAVVWQGTFVRAGGVADTAYRAFRIRALDRYVAP